MHLAMLHLAPILGAEKSKVPFYVAGGVLVAWAVIVSLGLGLRRPEFPGSKDGQRAVMAISAVLVLAAVATAVITAGASTKAQGAAAPANPPSATTQGAGAPASPPSAPTQATATPGNPPSTSTHARAAPGATSSLLALAANPGGQLSYDTKQLSARAGKVTIVLTNTASVEHDVAVAQGSTVLGTTPAFLGGRRTLTVSLKPGTYTFYCSVPGHRQAGMEGTLLVT